MFGKLIDLRNIWMLNENNWNYYFDLFERWMKIKNNLKEISIVNYLRKCCNCLGIYFIFYFVMIDCYMIVYKKLYNLSK